MANFKSKLTLVAHTLGTATGCLVAVVKPYFVALTNIKFVL